MPAKTMMRRSSARQLGRGGARCSLELLGARARRSPRPRSGSGGGSMPRRRIQSREELRVPCLVAVVDLHRAAELPLGLHLVEETAEARPRPRARRGGTAPRITACAPGCRTTSRNWRASRRRCRASVSVTVPDSFACARARAVEGCASRGAAPRGRSRRGRAATGGRCRRGRRSRCAARRRRCAWSPTTPRSPSANSSRMPW